VPDEPDFRNLIPGILERYTSLEEFLTSASSDPNALATFQSATALVAGNLYAVVWRQVIEMLFDHRRWRELAEDPKAFDERLDELLALIKSLQKARFGIPSHRPTKQEKRDAQIYAARRRDSEVSFEAIGSSFGIKGNAARQAYARYDRRKKQQLRSSLEAIARLQQGFAPSTPTKTPRP
jgi:hypothetical protein